MGVSHTMGAPFRAFVTPARAQICHRHGMDVSGLAAGGVNGGGSPAGVTAEGVGLVVRSAPGVL